MHSLGQTYLSPETEICFVITGNIFYFWKFVMIDILTQTICNLSVENLYIF